MGWETVGMHSPGRRGSGPVEFDIFFDDDGQVVGSYRERIGRTRMNNERVLMRVLINTADRAARARLETEWTVGDRLCLAWPETEYPDQLSRLVGGNIEAAMPFTVVTRRGDPISGGTLPHPLSDVQVSALVDGVFRGLFSLHSAGIVCRTITPDTVLWDGNAAQLSSFGDAVLASQPLQRPVSLAPAPWRAPDPRPGAAATADPRDDVFSACLVLFWLLTGFRPGTGLGADPEPAAVGEAVAELLEQQEPVVRRLLRGVFGVPQAQRVTARDLVTGLKVLGLTVPGDVVDPRWDQTRSSATADFREEYQALVLAQREFLATAPVRPVRPPSQLPPAAAPSHPSAPSPVWDGLDIEPLPGPRLPIRLSPIALLGIATAVLAAAILIVVMVLI